MKLKSSLIKSATHKDGVLEVKLHGDGTPIRYAAPVRVFNALKNAKSAGRYFNKKVRGAYPMVEEK